MKIKMFRNFLNKEKKLKAAFRAIKTDMDFMDENHSALKSSTNEWIMFLDQENRDLKMQVKELEKKLDRIENSFDEERLSILRAI